MLKLDKKQYYLLACSYGPDSMALFDMLLKQGYNFGVAHVNYHFRTESVLEEEGLKEYCQKNNICLYVYDNKEKVTKNIEARARDIRYNFFKKIYDEKRFDALLVAHHFDDSIETYILQKRRNLKVFWYGLNTFSHNFGMNIIRPLLDYTKEDLLNYCKKYNVPYAIDLSNFSDDFLRNKIRHEIINHLSYSERINYQRKMIEENTKVNNILKSFTDKNIECVDVLSTLDGDEFIYAIYLLAERAQIFKISRNNIKEIRKVILSEKPNVYIKYKDFIFVKEYGKVYFTKDLFIDDNYLFIIPHKMVLDTPYFYLDFTGDTSNRNVKDNDYPLTIRNASKDDLVKIKNYYKPIRRLFIDWKVPTRYRKRWPVILNHNGVVIYVPRYRSDYVIKSDDNFFVK